MSFDPTTSTDVRAEWRDDASCTTSAHEAPAMATAWISENHPLRDYAEQVCAECPVRFLCALDAVKDMESEGLRGGFYFSGGRVPTGEAAQMNRVLGLQPETRQRTRISKIAS